MEQNNRDENKTRDQLLAEKRDAEQILRNLSPEYLGIYVLDRKTGGFRDIIAPEFFREIAWERSGNYKEALLNYRDRFVREDDYCIIDHVLDYDTIYEELKELKEQEALKFSYHKKDGHCIGLEIKPYSGKKEEEHLSLWIYTDDALSEMQHNARIRSEIIEAIGKTYRYISRIDIQADYYEEITGLEELHTIEGNRTGSASGNAKRMCEKRVAEDFQKDFLEFTDMATLPARLRDRETVEFEYRVKDGQWNRIRFIVKRRDTQGEVTHVLCVIRNINDFKEREQKLWFHARQAEQEAREKARFLANMSHDIRTPMNGILGMLDLAENYPEDLKTQEYCRSKIRTTSNYLLSLINDVLDMSKLESDENELPFMNFDLAAMLRKTNEEMEKKAQLRQIDYVIDWTQTSYEHQCLIGNPVYASRILEIIADNAIKFSRHGSKVEVWCREERIDEKHSQFIFCCRDYGIGMSEEYTSHAFDMFSQENATGRTEYEGTGLGLTLAKKMADRIHATIEIESCKNVGTTVTTRIPFEIGQAEAMPEVLNIEDIDIRGMRALVAEDNELNMEIARFILEDNGLIVEGVFDGKEAVDKFENSAPKYYDVILMDIMMPKLDGRDAARRIRLLPREDAQSIPIIAMSANAFAEDIISSRLSGMDLHISKPVDNQKMITAIKRALAEHDRLMKV